MRMKTFITGVLLHICIGTLSAQMLSHEYFVTFDYGNMRFERSDSLPGVHWVSVNATYDADKKRFFFTGTDGLMQSWKIFTIDVISGRVLSDPELYTTESHNNFFAIEYDKGLKKLFTLYQDYTDDATYFAEIDPATGNTHVISEINGLNGFMVQSSCYDENDHRFIFAGYYDDSMQLIAIDALTGNVVYTYPLPAGQEFRYLEYSNVHHALYCIVSLSAPEPVFILETISDLTVSPHIIGEFPAVSTYQVGASEIDEQENRFIFAGAEDTSDYLYAVNISTGQLEAKWHDPYLDAADPDKENVIFFAWDDISGKLYALNWGPERTDASGFTGSPVCIDEKRISVSPNPGSENTTVSFGQTVGDAHIVIYNALHQAVFSFSIANIDHIDMPNACLPSGEYFLSIACSNGMAVKRFIIAK